MIIIKKKWRAFANDQDALNGALKEEIKTLSITYNYFNIFDVYPYRTLEKLSSPSTFISKEEFVKFVSNHVLFIFRRRTPMENRK